MSDFSRRQFLQTVGAAAAAAPAISLLGGAAPALARDANALTIAYNVDLPSWDPTSGPSAVNPTIQSIYKSVFGQYIDQNPDLSFAPGLITKWGWNDDKTKISMTVREGAFWHDGNPVTPEDVVWSLERAADPKSGNPIQFVWAKIGNFKISGQEVTADVKSFEPALFKWMAFLTGFVMPKKAYEKAGAQGFEKHPIGSGPYMVEEFQRNAFVRLKAFPKWWGGKVAFENVVFKFVTDPTSRVAEVESGSSDLTLEIPYEEYDRVRVKSGFAGSARPITDIGMLFITNRPPMLDRNLRLALSHAIDKKAIIDKLLRGYGVPIDTLEAPGYEAYDPSIKVPYDPALAKSLMAKSGFSPQHPVKFVMQTTRGYMPKDFEMIQAIAGMWREIGADATIEVYEVAKHFELRAEHKLAPAAFYDWGNAIGDPSTSTGFAMFGPSPHSAWKSAKLDAMIGPLWGMKDEAKRIAGYKAVDRYIAENGLVLPLLQYVQPVLYRSGLKFVPHTAGCILPQTIGKA